MPTPVGVRLRMYQVGFGDCFLLTFEYDEPVDGTRKEREILIDFGTMRAHPKWNHAATAELIKEHSHGRLDAIVVTHRHRDHMSGFGDAAASAIIDQLKPGRVIRPWTEDPKAATNATEATKVPRSTLLAALQKLGPLHATHKLAATRGYLELTADLKNFAGFVVTAPTKSTQPPKPPTPA